MVKNLKLTKDIRKFKREIKIYEKVISNEKKHAKPSKALIDTMRGKIKRRKAIISDLNSMLVSQGGQRI